MNNVEFYNTENLVNFLSGQHNNNENKKSFGSKKIEYLKNITRGEFIRELLTRWTLCI
jgi:hypothetical protein